MIINRSFKDFKFRHRSKKNQIIYTSKKVKNDNKVLNLIDNFLLEKNSFIFESVEKGKIKGRYTIFGKNPDKVWEFNKNNSVLATSGNNKFKFDIKQQGFAWMTSNKKEKIMVRVMKKGSRIMLTGYNEKGSQTIDHYSLLGFTKAYNTAKKACS